MSPQERLLAFEMEFRRRLREASPGREDDGDMHTSWAMAMGYEMLISQARGSTAAEIVRLSQRMLALGDQRDVMAARDSVMQLLGIRQFV